MKKQMIPLLCVLLLLSPAANAAKTKSSKKQNVVNTVILGLAATAATLTYAYDMDQDASNLVSGTPGELIPGSDPNSMDLTYSNLLADIYADDKMNIARTQRDVPQGLNVASVSLPQFDLEPASRNESLNTMKSAIQNYPRQYAYDGATPIPIGRGPRPIPGTLAGTMVSQEAADLVNRETQNSTARISEAIFGLPVTTLKNIEDLYSHMDGYPIPEGLANWKDDRYFADQRRTTLGHKLERLRKPLFNINLSDAQLQALLGKGRNLRDVKLYGVDLWEVGHYSAQDGRGHYAPSVQAMFGKNAKNEFVVLAIKLGNNHVYTRFDSEGEWTLAKIALNTAEFLWTSANHFLTTHLVVEPIRVELMRQVSYRHPVSILMSHHMKNLFGNTVAGLVSLFTKGTTLDLLSGWGAEGYMRFYGNHSADYLDFSRTFDSEIKRRGLGNDFKNYRQRNDMSGLVGNIRSFVHEYLVRFYGKKSVRDQNVLNDYELQAWAKACSSSDGAGISNFPNSFTSLAQLEETLTHLIYLIAIKHHAMNLNALWHGHPLPGTPMALWAPLPTEKGAAVEPRNFLPPTKNLILAQILLLEKFLRKLNPAESLVNSYDEPISPLGDDLENIVLRYKLKMNELTDKIRKRELKDRDRSKYDILSPSELPFFIGI